MIIVSVTVQRVERANGAIEYYVEDGGRYAASLTAEEVEPGVWWLSNFSVRADVRRLGVGGRVLAAALEDADRGAYALALRAGAVGSGTAGALPQNHLEAFYERRGFVWQEEHGRYFRPVHS